MIKVELRALEPTDADLLYQWENDIQIWKYTNTLVPFSKFDLEQYILSADKDPYKQKQVRFMIDKEDENNTTKTIGSIDIFDFDPLNRRAGVGIMISKDERKKNYAFMALQQLIDYAFNVLNLHQLYSNITTDNFESIKLFEKAGFIKTGIKKEWLMQNNEWKDEMLMQLINNQV